MGGRGSWSMTGSGGGKVRMLGKSINVHMSGLGGPVDSRRDVRDVAQQAGFAGALGTDDIGTSPMGSYIAAVNKLERQYGAMRDVPTYIAGADGSGFYAAAMSNNDFAVLAINRELMGNAAKHAKATAREGKSGFKMPTDGRLTSDAHYTIVHEYGHLLQGALYRNAARNGYIGSEKQYRSKAYREIKGIAEKKYKANGNGLSGYGRYDTAEFFAECFAGANSGRPTAYGKATSDWLKKNKL